MCIRDRTYEVDQISIVLPTETDNLKVVDGKDYVTLMTCTPYGINSCLLYTSRLAGQDWHGPDRHVERRPAHRGTGSTGL